MCVPPPVLASCNFVHSLGFDDADVDFPESQEDQGQDDLPPDPFGEHGDIAAADDTGITHEAKRRRLKQKTPASDTTYDDLMTRTELAKANEAIIQQRRAGRKGVKKKILKTWEKAESIADDVNAVIFEEGIQDDTCLLYTSPSPRD